MKPSVCTIEDCVKPVIARGWCRAHYTRWDRYGDPVAGQPDRLKAGTDGWRDRYEINAETGCWNWTGSLDRGGYGQYHVADGTGGSKGWRAHRYVYTQLVRPLRDDEVIDHVCRNHRCVNPDPAHLEPVTQKVNADRGDYGAGKLRKTHCKNGHEYTPENTLIVTATGGRNCRACARATAAERMRRHREKKKPS